MSDITINDITSEEDKIHYVKEALKILQDIKPEELTCMLCGFVTTGDEPNHMKMITLGSLDHVGELLKSMLPVLKEAYINSEQEKGVVH